MIALNMTADEQFERHALEVLGRELGADGLADEILDSIQQRRPS